MDRDLNILVPVVIDPYLFVKQLRDNATYEEILDIIIALDESMEDWDFTLMVYNHFDDQYDKYMEANDTFGK